MLYKTSHSNSHNRMELLSPHILLLLSYYSIFNLFKCMGALPVNMSVYHIHVRFPQRPKEGIGSLKHLSYRQL